MSALKKTGYQAGRQEVTRYASDFYHRTDAALSNALANSAHLALPELRAFWVGSTYYPGGSEDLIDYSPHGVDLTKHNSPLFGAGYSLLPHVTMNSTGYFTSASLVDLDVNGADAWVESGLRGLTLGGWFYSSTVLNNVILVDMLNYAGKSGYRLIVNATNYPGCFCGDGATLNTINALSTFTTDRWNWIVMRFKPSTTLEMIIDGEVNNTLAAGVVANLDYTGVTGIAVGAIYGGGNYYGRYISRLFVCGAYLPNRILQGLYGLTAPAYQGRTIT